MYKLHEDKHAYIEQVWYGDQRDKKSISKRPDIPVILQDGSPVTPEKVASLNQERQKAGYFTSFVISHFTGRYDAGLRYGMLNEKGELLTNPQVVLFDQEGNMIDTPEALNDAEKITEEMYHNVEQWRETQIAKGKREEELPMYFLPDKPFLGSGQEALVQSKIESIHNAHDSPEGGEY